MDRESIFADDKWSAPKDYTRTRGLLGDIRQAHLAVLVKKKEAGGRRAATGRRTGRAAHRSRCPVPAIAVRRRRQAGLCLPLRRAAASVCPRVPRSSSADASAARRSDGRHLRPRARPRGRIALLTHAGQLTSIVILGIVALATLAAVVAIAWSLGMLRQPARSRAGRLLARGRGRVRAPRAELAARLSERARGGRARARRLPAPRGQARGVAHCQPCAPRRRRCSRARTWSCSVAIRSAPWSASRSPARRARARRPRTISSSRSRSTAASDTSGAEETFRTVARDRPDNAPSPRIYEPAFRYLRGLYLLKAGRAEEAAEDLAAASASPVTTTLRRARASPRRAAVVVVVARRRRRTPPRSPVR